MRDNSRRGTSKLAILGVLSLLALIVGMGAIRTNLAHAATITVVVGQTNGGGVTGVNQYNAATIVITRNDTVTWNSAVDGRAHDVASAVIPAGGTAWASPTLDSDNVPLAGRSFSTTLAVDGVYTYYCTLHATAAQAALAVVDGNITTGVMVGKITVNAPVADTLAPTVSAVAAAPNPTAGSSAVTLTATVTDTAPVGATALVAGAEWSKGAAAVAAGTGTAMAASDLAFDSATEGVTANVPITEAAGTSVTIWVRGRDAAGLWSAAAVSTLVSVTAPPAGAVQATVTVSGGSLSNVAQNIAFPGVTLTGLNQTVAGTTTPAWQAKDARGTGAGWNVTVISSNFTGAGSITVDNFKVQLTAVTTVAGNTAPLPTPATYVALSIATPLKLLSAGLNTGMGTYDYTPLFQLTVPGSVVAGSYTANVSVSVNTGP